MLGGRGGLVNWKDEMKGFARGLGAGEASTPEQAGWGRLAENLLGKVAPRST